MISKQSQKSMNIYKFEYVSDKDIDDSYEDTRHFKNENVFY